MPSSFITPAFVLGGAGLVFFILSLVSTKKRSILGFTLTFSLAVICLCLAALCGAMTLATKGYRALTREEVAAVVRTRPTGIMSFEARFHFPDGRQATYRLSGDELYVDAHILKWKPWANLIGVHTTYELDRVAGRYTRLEDEQSSLRTVFGLSQDKPFDMFDLRRRHPLLEPLVDAEYGSATFIPVDEPAAFEVRVSTTGLLIRRIEDTLTR